MNKIKKILKEYQLDLHTLLVFRRAEKTIRNQEQVVVKDYDLTISQFSVLETLYNKGPLRIQDLIDRLLASSGNMTVVIKNMERDGWINKVPDETDRRAWKVSLTDSGRELIEKILPEHYMQVVKIMSVLSDEDKEDLIRILRKFKDLA